MPIELVTNENIDNTDIILNKKEITVPCFTEVPFCKFLNVITLHKRNFLFKTKPVTLNLYKKFTLNKFLEKYTIGFNEHQPEVAFLLKIYKDSIFIVDLKVKQKSKYIDLIDAIVQIASERALADTIRKEVKINIKSSVSLFKNDISAFKRLDFISQDNQTQFEKKFLGEALELKVVKSSTLMKKIKKSPILI